MTKHIAVADDGRCPVLDVPVYILDRAVFHTLRERRIRAHIIND